MEAIIPTPQIYTDTKRALSIKWPAHHLTESFGKVNSPSLCLFTSMLEMDARRDKGP